MARLRIDLLGGFRVALDGKPITALRSTKGRALLAFVAVEADRPHRRESLASMLWPEFADQDARNNLRYALSDLRSALGDQQASPPFLLVTRETIQFNLSSDFWLDVHALAQLVTATGCREGNSVAGIQHIDPLRKAVDLVKGGFLEGFSVDSAPFEEWAMLKRVQIERDLTDALACLASLYEREGNFAQAEIHVRRCLELEPWNEEAHRHLMQLLALSGNRGAALAHFRECNEVLRRELGVGPAVETERLYQDILAGMVGPKPGAQARGSSEPPVAPRAHRLQSVPDGRVPPQAASFFADRERELAKLDALLQQVLAGKGQVVFVTGERGSGKTMLVEEFLRRTLHDHPTVVVATGRCTAQSGIGDPFVPFQEIHRALQPLIPADFDARLVSYFEPLPDLDKSHGLPFPRGGLAEPSRAGLLEEAANAVRLLSENHHIVLVLSQLHWADHASLSLLFYLAQHLRDSSVLIIGTYRSPIITRTFPTADAAGELIPIYSLVNELRLLYGDIEIALNEADGRAFVDAMVDAEPNVLDADFRDTLVQHTGGNALFVSELLQFLKGNGMLARDAQGRWMLTKRLQFDSVPPRVEAIIAERLNHVTQQERVMLSMASVIGAEFSAEVLAHALDMGVGEVVHVLSGSLARRHKLVTADQLNHLGGILRTPYRFRHAIVRCYLHQALDPAERTQYNQAVAQALEHLIADDPAALHANAQRLAYHFEAAHLPERALPYLLLAGQQATRLTAYEEAIALLSRGLSLAEALPDPRARHQWQTDFLLALDPSVISVHGRGSAERSRVLRQADTLCRRTGNSTQLYKALFALADHHRAKAEYKKSSALGAEMLAMADRSGDPVQRAMAHWSEAEDHFFRGNFGAATQNLQAMRRQIDLTEDHAITSLGGRRIDIIGACWHSWILWLTGYPDQALAVAMTAQAQAASLSHPPSQAFAQVFAKAAIHYLRREPERVLECLPSLALQSDTAHAPLGPWMLMFIGWGYAMKAQFEQSIALIQKGMSVWQAIGALSGYSFQAVLLAEAYLLSGLLTEGLALIDDAIDMVERSDERCLEAELWRLKGELALAAKQEDREVQAEACFRRAIDAAQRQGALSLELRATIPLARLLHQRGQTIDAAQDLGRIFNQFDEGLDTADLQSARQLLLELHPTTSD